MPVRLYDSAGAADRDTEKEARSASPTRIVVGSVVNNCDLIGQGKVLVRVHSIGEEIWCRLTAIGGGPGAGFVFVPQIGDEVVVGECGADSFVLGGLWSTKNSPPVDPLQAPTKRLIKTGIGGVGGHQLEFDDVKQSVNIVTSTQQQINLDPLKIEVSNAAGTLRITLDEATQTLTVAGVNVSIEAAAKLTLKGRVTELKAEPGPMSISATAACAVKGLPIQLNCAGP